MRTYKLHITESFTPDTIPMVRLAEYLAEFGKVLGEIDSVHFAEVTDGSVSLAAFVETPAQPKVFDRLKSLAHGDGPSEARNAWQRIDDMLAKDNAAAELLDGDNVVVVNFPGKHRTSPKSYGPFSQEGIIEGEVVRVGGMDDSAHVTLRDGDRVYSGCVVSKDLARLLANHLFGGTVRARGTGKWVRHPDGEWELRSFRIKSFELLDDTPLTDLVDRLRAIGGNEWGNTEDPFEEVLSERGDRSELPN